MQTSKILGGVLTPPKLPLAMPVSSSLKKATMKGLLKIFEMSTQLHLLKALIKLMRLTLELAGILNIKGSLKQHTGRKQQTNTEHKRKEDTNSAVLYLMLSFCAVSFLYVIPTHPWFNLPLNTFF